MTRVFLKYPLVITNKQVLELPKQSVITAVEDQNGILTV